MSAKFTARHEGQQLLEGKKVFGEFTGCVSNEGIQCGWIPQAWFAILASLLQIVLYAPLALFSTQVYEAWIGARILLRMALWGMEPWAANVALLFGLGNLFEGIRLEQCSVPIRETQGKHQRIRNSFMSDVLGSDFIMGEGDYDQWMPPLFRWIGAQVLSRMAVFYSPTVLEPKNLIRCDRSEFDSICETTIERFGDKFGSRVDLTMERHSEAGAIRLCTEGQGAFALERRGGSYVVDYSSLEVMPVRDWVAVMECTLRLTLGTYEMTRFRMKYAYFISMGYFERIMVCFGVSLGYRGLLVWITWLPGIP